MADFPNFGNLLKNPFQNPGQFVPNTPDLASINTPKPLPNTNADPNVAVQTSKDAGNDMNFSTDPLNQTFNVFQGMSDAITQSMMQRGNGWFNFDPSRWNQNYYYRFLILEASGTSSLTAGVSSGYTIKASYKFPLNPSNIVTSTPYAINLTITSDGAFEEHNGTPIKNLVISGTTGIMPNRQAFGQVNSLPGPFGQLASAVAPNTVRAISQTIQQASSLVNSFNSVIGNTDGTGKAPTQALLTGYAQYQLLKLFVDGYATLKTLPGSQKYRLAFHNPKDNVTYLVTPGEFQEIKGADSPLEYRYQIPMTAWATVSLTGVPSKQNPSVANTFNILKGDIVNTLIKTRQTIAQFSSILTAVKSDYKQTIVGPMNLAILALKSTTGLFKSPLDYGSEGGQFVQSVAPTLIKNSSTNPNIPGSVKAAAATAMNQINAGANNTSVSSTPTPIVGGSGTSTGGSVSATVQGGVNVDSYTLAQLADSVPVTSLPLNASQIQIINYFEEQASTFRNKDYLKLADNLDDLSNSLEASGMDQDKFTIQYSINDARTALYGLTSTSDFDDQQTMNAIQYWEVKSQQAGINFVEPNSKFAVPFPLNGTLEWLAQTYLGDATRWLEIAALNNLQPPYVDEQGFRLSFISNGSGNQFNVSDISNLFDGQKIVVSSSTQLASSRTILAIQKITDTNFLMTVDGPSNLSDFTTADGAYLQAYLPFTVNSQRNIYIPSPSNPTTTEEDTKPIPYLQVTPDLVQFSKVDWLLTPDGDIASTEDGFFNLAVGSNNLVQAARLKVLTTLNSLLLHPNYGNPLEIGEVTANVSPADIKSKLDNTFARDPRFTGVNSLTATISPGKVALNMDVGTTFNGSSLPLDFNLK